EQAFRTCKTAHLEVRPIFLRREARTRAHAFVVMLAYQIIHYLTACWSPLDITVAEGLHALTTLCLVEVSPKNAPSYHCIPTPRDAIARLLHRADIKLPKAFSLSGVRVSTKKKLQSERRLQCIQLLNGLLVLWIGGEDGFQAAEDDPANLKLCQRGEWEDRMLVETVLSMLTLV